MRITNQVSDEYNPVSGIIKIEPTMGYKIIEIDMEQINISQLIKEEPEKEDFYNDMNHHTGATYEERNKFIIEMERDLGGRNSGKDMARITIWKPQEYNSKYVPDVTDEDNKYYWIAVARRFIQYDEDVPTNLRDSDYHFSETLERYEYEGPRERMNIEVVDSSE